MAATTTAIHLAPPNSSMASKRLPLANVPNAINSPFRQGIASKRTRAQSGDTRESTQEEPPAKKQLLEYRHGNEENIDPQRKVLAIDEPFLKRPANSQPTALERKFAAIRDKKPTATLDQRSIDNLLKISEESLESLRQWQRHYRRQFPHFVFFFDGIQDDVRSKIVRQLQSLGAREEKFFSHLVTHVVTTRPLPAEAPAPFTTQPIIPLALEDDQRTITSMLDNHLQRRMHDTDARRVASQAADVLVRARELKIKIWPLEKVQRVLKTMLEAITGEHGVTVDIARQPALAIDKPQQIKTHKDADLEQLLRNEKINGPADRDMTVIPPNMCFFRGCYIYIHDMDEETKPVMARDYPKPAHKGEGKWPQFHLSSIGRCPFIEDLTQQELEKKQAKAQRARTRASAVAVERTQPLAERQPNLRRSPRKLNNAVDDDLAKPLDPPKLIPTKRTAPNDEMPAVFGSAQINVRGLPRMIGGMPIASGMQNSNVTSAIRSQAISSAAISSTAAGMHRRLPDSKEVSVLKRKVLERTTSVPSQLPSSYMNDMRAAINDEPAGPPPRAAKRKAQESILGVVHEDEESTSKQQQQQQNTKKRSVKKTKLVKDPKSGYCENCRDKFDDFEEHCNSRKHQKFARSAVNWKDLDDLLKKLKRTHREH